MLTKVPVVEPWTPVKGLAATVGVLVSIPVGYAVAVWGWLDWCTTVGLAAIDNGATDVDRGAVSGAMLLEHAGLALWALPWLLLALLRRRHRLESVLFGTLAALLLAWNVWGFLTALSDPVAAEQTRCWHW